MDRSLRRALEFTGVQLTAVVAGIHLLVGIPLLVQLHRASVPVYQDPRGILFVASAIALLAGLVLVDRGVLPRAPAYALGIALLGCYLVGWAYWHLAGHEAVIPWVDDTVAGHTHGRRRQSAVSILFEHMIADPLEGVSKIAEAALAAILGVLLYDEWRNDAPAESTATGDRGADPDADADEREETVRS